MPSLKDFIPAARQIQTPDQVSTRRVFLTDFHGTIEKQGQPKSDVISFLAEKAAENDLVIVASTLANEAEVRKVLAAHEAGAGGPSTASFLFMGKEELMRLQDETGQAVVFEAQFDDNDLDATVMHLPKTNPVKNFIHVTEDGLILYPGGSPFRTQHPGTPVDAAGLRQEFPAKGSEVGAAPALPVKPAQVLPGGRTPS